MKEDGKKLPKGVYEKEPGSSVFWIRYADATGRIRREKAGTVGNAIKLYRKRKTAVDEGKKFPERLRQRAVSFADIAKEALAYSKSHKRSYGDDVIRMERLLTWFRDRAAESITPQDIERKLAEASAEEEWAPATANRHRALLSLTYSLAIRNGKVTSNPARLVKHRMENNARVRWLSADEEKALRETIAADSPEHMPELEIALNTGLRLSEQYNLRWENVDFLNRVLTVPRSKNGEVRHVPLNTVALAAFARVRAGKTGDGFVFVSTRTNPVTGLAERLTGPRYWFEPAVEKAKLSDFTWHCLRHTFASRLVMAGADIRTVQELMGHKTLTMTVRYSHLAPTHQLAAVERLLQPMAATQADNGKTETPTDTTTDTAPSAPASQEARYTA